MKTAIVCVSGIAAGIVMLGGLAGCGSSADVQTQAVRSSGAYVSPGKSRGPVMMTHRFLSKPAVGESMELELTFSSGSSGDMLVQIHADDPLGVAPVIDRPMRSGESVVVDIRPQAEGRHYVNVVARVGGGSRTQPGVFSIPVQVGSVGVHSKAQEAETGPDGERLIRMRAQDNPSDQGR